ncbi:FAD-binding protein, partial [Nocardia abscessus]|uniref:FAD-binding protein n=1 Tax=Nocardia abscessus TaxID=120957 RepID=UPI002455A9E0
MPSQQQERSATTADVEVDVVVLGSGAAGLTAALSAAVHGASVAVFEKAATRRGDGPGEGGGAGGGPPPPAGGPPRSGPRGGVGCSPRLPPRLGFLPADGGRFLEDGHRRPVHRRT